VSEDGGMPDEERSEPDVPRRARGWVSLYAVAFLLLVGAGVAIVASAAGLLVSTRLLWTSTVLSGLAIVTAIASVVLPRR
jgi:hypothetical protein